MADFKNIPDFTKEENAILVLDFVHRISVHYGIWLAEARHNLGPEKALDILEKTHETTMQLMLQRLSKTLAFNMEGSLPSFLMEMEDEKLLNLRDSLAINWLAYDGIWFQSVEFSEGMDKAKACNDASWSYFSPFEARSVKKLLNLPENPGLEGLKKALNLRLYAFINKQSIHDETDNSFIFRMDDCRVQTARKRKGLADYSCKSGGTVEYTEFAKTIDKRIITSCVCCPPDEHPDTYYCAWKFELVN